MRIERVIKWRSKKNLTIQSFNFINRNFKPKEKINIGVSYEVSSLWQCNGVREILWSRWKLFGMEMHPMWRNH